MPTRRAARRLLLLAAPLLLAGCVFDYKNPAEALRTGQATGLVLADRTAAPGLEPFPGVSVSLKGSQFDVNTHESGRFTLYGLPVGSHTLLFRRGTTWALDRQVDIAFGSDGQPEGLDLGQVELRYAAAVDGTFTLPTSFPGDAMAWGVAVDEATGQTATMLPDDPPNALRGRFTFPALGVGTHRLKVAAQTAGGASYVGGPAVVTIAATDTVKIVAAIAPHGAAAVGTIAFRVQTVGLTLPLDQVTVTIDPDPGALLLPPVPLNPLPVASDGSVQVQVPEGVYRISVAVPGSAPVGRLAPASSRALVTTTPLPPPLATAVVLGGDPAALGTVYAVGQAVLGEASLACQSAADCGGLACVGGLCQDYSPPFAVGATTPFCSPCTFQGGTQQRCDLLPGSLKGDGVCRCPYDAAVCASAAPPGPSVCVPLCATGQFCTVDAIGSECQ